MESCKVHCYQYYMYLHLVPLPNMEDEVRDNNY